MRLALCATQHLSNSPDEETDFYQGKLKACRYFFVYELPKTRTQMDLLQTLDDTCLNMVIEQF